MRVMPANGPATQVGFSRLAHLMLPISGKPENGGRPDDKLRRTIQ
jgi:hypothetical protein